MVDICTISLQGLSSFQLLKTGVYSWWTLLKLSWIWPLGAHPQWLNSKWWPSRDSLQSSFDIVSLSGHKTLGRAAAYPVFSFKYFVEINVNEDWLTQWDIQLTWFLIHLFWGSLPCVLVNFWIALMFGRWIYRNLSTEHDSFTFESQIQICSPVMFGFLSAGIPSSLATLTMRLSGYLQSHADDNKQGLFCFALLLCSQCHRNTCSPNLACHTDAAGCSYRRCRGFVSSLHIQETVRLVWWSAKTAPHFSCTRGRQGLMCYCSPEEPSEKEGLLEALALRAAFAHLTSQET